MRGDTKMNRIYFKRRITILLVWMLAVGCIGLSGILQSEQATAQSVGVPLTPPVACEEAAVQQTVYVSVYNVNSGQTLCYESSIIELTGSVNDPVEVTVHAPGFDPEAGYSVDYQLNQEPYASFENMESKNHKLSENFVISGSSNTLQIGVKTSRNYGSMVYAKPSGTLVYSRYSDENGVMKLNQEGQASPSGHYDLLINSSGYAEWGIKLVDSSGQQLSGFAAASLNNDGRHTFAQVPIPSSGQIYAVYTPPGAQGSSEWIKSVLIGHLPESNQVIKVVLDPERHANITLDRVVRTDATLSQLARIGNNLYLLENEPADLRNQKEILLEVTRNNPNNPTSGGAKHLLTAFYRLSEPSPYADSHYIPIYPDYWRTVTLVPADPAMPGNALANVRVYLNLEDYYPTPGYTYTDSQGKATFYDLNSYNVELPYTFSLASEDGGDGYRPALIQTGPDFWNNETNETQLKVISLKRPGGTDPNAEFQLKDLVWFAQNFQSHGYDMNQDGQVTKEDLQILLKILAPERYFD